MGIIQLKKNLHGTNVSHNKKAKNEKTQCIKTSPYVLIPMVQHMGAPCIPLVQVNDHVYAGQKIGESEEYFSVPIHASCSGTVLAIEDYCTTNGTKCKAVKIETQAEQEMDKSIAPPIIKDKNDFINAIKDSGLVGLGGAGFPTFIKLAYKDIDKVNKLVINAAECEPYITSDFRECMENTQNIADGIKLVQRYLNIKEVYIGVEDNKPEVIQKFNEVFKKHIGVKVVALKTMYPQGAEKSIIYETTSVIVSQGKLPADCGVIVMNVSTVGFIGNYIKTGIPLISKRITVDGDFVSNPQNLLVPIGTPIKDILAFMNINEGYSKILMGGPMMGIPVINTDYPVIKNNNAIILLSDKASTPPPTTACIRCGKCISSCPMHLMPANLEKAYDKRDATLLKDLNVSLCIDCGCCSYVCPAKRHLAQKNQLAKLFLKNAKKG